MTKRGTHDNAEMIITRTPLRLEFLGGSTDIASFYRRTPGHILNATIDKYIHIIVKKTDREDILFIHEKLERVSRADELTHERARAVLKHFHIKNGIEIVSLSDVGQGGSGLGSSSSFTVGLVHALAVFTRARMSVRGIAELAAHIEIDVVGAPIGKQDQFVAAFGGTNHTMYQKNGFVEVKPIRISLQKTKAFHDHLLVFRTGTTRSASAILGDQAKREKEIFPYLKTMAGLVEPAARAFAAGDFKRFAELLYKEWTIKKNLGPGVTNNEIETMYAKAKRAGAWGGRVSGAGGGGFLFMLAPQSRHGAIRRALKKYDEFPLHLTDEGTILVLRETKETNNR